MHLLVRVLARTAVFKAFLEGDGRHGVFEFLTLVGLDGRGCVVLFGKEGDLFGESDEKEK